MRGRLRTAGSGGAGVPEEGARPAAPRSRPLRVAATAMLAAEVEDVHLGEWLFALTDEEFRAVSAAHVALGHCSRDLEGAFVTVETVSRTLVVTHFREEIARADHIRVRSTDCRAYAFPGCVSRAELVWDLAVRPAEPGLGRDLRAGRCELHSTLQLLGGAATPLPKARARPFGLGGSGLAGLDLRRSTLRPLVRGIHAHLLHETRGFAADIETKFGRRVSLGLAR